MKYTVKFLRKASVWETICAEVEAGSVKEIQDKLRLRQYEIIDFSNFDYFGNDDTITDIEIL